MSLYEHKQESFGKPVKEWRPGVSLDDPANTAYRIALEYDEAEAGVTWEERFNRRPGNNPKQPQKGTKSTE